MSWTREFWMVIVPVGRREYVCVWQEERGDRAYYNAELAARGYQLHWVSEASQCAEMQAVMHEHGFRRIIVMRQLTAAHDLIRCRALPNPRPMIVRVELLQ